MLTEIFTKEFDPKANEMYYYPLRAGDSVICRFDGKLRSAEVIELIGEDKVKVVCWSPERKEIILPVDKVQLTEFWNYPETRKNL